MKNFILEIVRLDNLRLKHWLVIFSAYLLLHVPAILRDTGHTNLAVYQAKAFLESRTDVQEYFWDASVYNGKNYVSFPPFPAIVALPFALISDHVNTVLISVLLSFITMFAFYRILERLIPERQGRTWIFMAYFFGTGYWYMLLTSHHINGFAHIISSCLIMLLLCELMGRQRPVLLGLYLAATFLSRQMTIFYGLLLIYLIVTGAQDKKAAFRKIIVSGIAFAIPAAAYLYFNYMRFGDPFDTGYGHILYSTSQGDTLLGERVHKYGLFSWKYFWFNFYHMFLKGHNIIFTGDGLLQPKSIDLFGTSVVSASPFLIAALKPKEKRGIVTACWLTICCITITLLLYHNNGWQQVNTQRFSLDFMPILMLLVAWGYASVPPWLFRLLILYAIGLNCFSLALHLYLN